MAFFDLFRPKKKIASPDAGPRCHHYTMAHHALRQVALEDPLMYLGVLASPDAEPFLASLFQSVCNHCSERGEKPDFKPSDLQIHRTRVNGFPCVIVEMPPPIATAEAYFTALIGFLDPSQKIAEDTKVEARYFTLEHGFNLDGTPRTVMCEWDNESHMNFGSGPSPTVGEFIRALSGFANSERP